MISSIYADDIKLYLSFNLSRPSSVAEAKFKLGRSISDIQDCMRENKLKLNGDKTEISSPFNHQGVHIEKIQTGVIDINPASSVRIGVIFYSDMSVDKHLRKYSTAYYHIRNFDSIHIVLTHDSTMS
jgi:hypothetical protein